ncbi:MAG: DUF4910 domain-containing protein [Nitrosopumilus sp.]|nr:DUF4910 domain-containing protein [Nitrosopumilus sp.]
MYQLIKRLYPICRSITGNGVRETLKILQEKIPLEIIEVSTGTKCYDWTIPKEWNIKDAYIKDQNGNVVVSFHESNLHVVSYSVPIHQKLSFDELKKHIHYIEEKPDAIPYRTSYYDEYWGFCMTYKQFKKMKDGLYEVCIDSSLDNGSLTYGEYFKQGKLRDEILLSCYVCHPSLCNDNLSGVSLVATLASILQNMTTKFSYRFLFIPETIGAIAWLSRNESKIQNTIGGLVATCCGDTGSITYKRSRHHNSFIDVIVERVLSASGDDFSMLDFWPSGSDERQFSSPGFNMPIGSLMRTVYDTFEEYHTSKDDLSFMDEHSLGDSLKKYLDVIYELERTDFIPTKMDAKFKPHNDSDPVFVSTNMKCEPRLGNRGLYHKIGALTNQQQFETKRAIQWLLNFSDGYHSVSDISRMSGIAFGVLLSSSKLLLDADLLRISV